jgi:hypothetical protein
MTEPERAGLITDQRLYAVRNAVEGDESTDVEFVLTETKWYVDDDGTPIMESFHVDGPLTLAEAGEINLGRWFELLVASRRASERAAEKYGFESVEAMFGSGVRPAIPIEDDDQKYAREFRRQRRPQTEALFAQVAELYREGGAANVAAEIGVSDRQASRYIKRARERGLLT